MSDAIVVALIMMLGQLVIALVNLMVSRRTRNELRFYGQQVNGRLDQVVSQTAAASHAAGHAQGVIDQKAAAHTRRRTDRPTGA